VLKTEISVTRPQCVNKQSKKGKSISPSAIQVENRRKTIITEEKLDVICPLEKGEGIVDIHRNVRFAHNSLRKIRYNAGRIKESIELKKALSQKPSVCVVRLPQRYWNEPYQKLRM